MDSPDYLFVTFDAGDALSLLPLFEDLTITENKIAVLAFGPSAPLLKSLKTARFFPEVIGRDVPVDKKTLDAILGEYHPKCVLAGAVAKCQEQVILGFRSRGIKTACYFETLNPTDLATEVLPFLHEDTSLLASSISVAQRLKELNPAAEPLVVGQPRCDQWNSKGNDQRELVHFLAMEPRFNKGKKNLLYTGTYCDDHRELFSLFANAAPQLSEVNLLCSLHPRENGDVERDVATKLGVQNIIFLPRSVSSMDAATLSDIVVCHRSTLGFQALFMGKSVIYLDTEGSTFSDLPITEGWAKASFTTKGFVTEIQKLLKDGPALTKDIYELVGLPRNGIANLRGFLDAHS